MAINLLDIVKDQISGPLAQQASSFLGESEAATKSGLDAIFPTLLGSLIDKSTEPAGAAGILNMIKDLDMGTLSNIGSLFGGGASNVNGLLNSGGGIVNSLLGDKMGSIVSVISNVSGMKSGSSSSLMKLAAPFLMSMIGKKMSGGGVSGLTDLLMSQKDVVAKNLPAGMGNLLGLANLGGGLKNITGSATATAKATAGNARDTATKTVGKTAAVIDETASSGMGFIKWLLPILLIAALAIFALRSCGDDIENAATDAVNKTTEVATDATKAAGDAVAGAAAWTAEGISNVFSKVDETAKAALDNITFREGSAGSQMIEYIEGGFNGDPLFRFNNLTYATGSAQIEGSSNLEIDNIAAILKTYPGVKISIEGHTDNVGDAANNKRLSQARAESVKARLIGQGIDPSRLSTAGFGQENPIASNDTDEGRTQNRRTEIRIVK